MKILSSELVTTKAGQKVLTLTFMDNGTRHSIKSLPISKGGNGAIAIFFACNTPLKENFVLKTNRRKSVIVTSREMLDYIYDNETVVIFGDNCEESQKLKRAMVSSMQDTTFDNAKFTTCYYQGEICAVKSVDGAVISKPDKEAVIELVQKASEVVLIRGAAKYSSMRTKLWEKVQRLPVIIHTMKWTGQKVKLQTIGPVDQISPLIIKVAEKELYSTMSALNGPGILPNKLVSLGEGEDNIWLKMPYGQCFSGINHYPDASELLAITERLARANQTLLEMKPPRFCGDNKPANVCKWASEDDAEGRFYMLDIDEIPTLSELYDGGGPRCFATFQLAGDKFVKSPTLMVLYSWMATISSYCSRANMEWVYTHTCHQQPHLPQSVHPLMNASRFPPKIDALMEEAARLSDSELDVPTLISFFKSVQSSLNETPRPKRRRLSALDSNA